MLEDMINPPEQQFSLEDISSPITAQILHFNDDNDINYFADDLHAAELITTNTTATTTNAASCDNQGLYSYIDDDDSFDFDPATICSLLDNDQPTNYEMQDVTYQLPETYQNQGELNQLLVNDPVNGPIWPAAASPVSVIPPDTDAETRPGWRPWPTYNLGPAVPLTEEQPIQMMDPPVGFMGIDMLPTCTFLDNDMLNGYQQIMNGGDGQIGFFHGRMMTSGESGMEVQDGGVYRTEAGQRFYNSLDMQVMGNFTSLVDGCNSNPTVLPTSDVTPLDDSTTKIGRLSPEERKEKIDRYLKKRTERNFNKKIKYACRKTLADSRPRVRGRFAKNDEHGEGTSRTGPSNHEYYDEEEVVVKEEQDILNSTDIFAHISGVNSFNYNYALESWI